MTIPSAASAATASEAARSLYRDLLLKVAYVPVGDLTRYARHARTHDEGQIDQIKASIAAFGFVSPLIVDHNHVLIAGHARLLAAEALGFERVPVLRLDHLSEADAAAQDRRQPPRRTRGLGQIDPRHRVLPSHRSRLHPRPCVRFFDRLHRASIRREPDVG